MRWRDYSVVYQFDAEHREATVRAVSLADARWRAEHKRGINPERILSIVPDEDRERPLQESLQALR